MPIPMVTEQTELKAQATRRQHGATGKLHQGCNNAQKHSHRRPLSCPEDEMHDWMGRREVVTGVMIEDPTRRF